MIYIAIIVILYHFFIVFDSYSSYF